MKSEQEIVIESRFTFTKDYSEVITLQDLHFRSKVNVLCKTKSVEAAARVLKVSSAHLNKFLRENGLTSSHLKAMREEYKEQIQVGWTVKKE